jgi:hypothetical protein
MFIYLFVCVVLRSGDFRSPFTRDEIRRLIHNRAADVVISGE